MTFHKLVLQFADKNLNGLVINLNSDNLVVSRDMVRDALFGNI